MSISTICGDIYIFIFPLTIGLNVNGNQDKSRNIISKACCQLSSGGGGGGGMRCGQPHTMKHDWTNQDKSPFSLYSLGLIVWPCQLCCCLICSANYKI